MRESRAQLGGDDDARAGRPFADPGDMAGDPPLGIADQVREDVRVEPITGQSETGERGGSSMFGNVSSIGVSSDRGASSDGGGAGSMIGFP